MHIPGTITRQRMFPASLDYIVRDSFWPCIGYLRVQYYGKQASSIDLISGPDRRSPGLVFG